MTGVSPSASLSADPKQVRRREGKSKQPIKRIVHVVPALFGRGGVMGGAERYAFELARHMADQAAVTLVTFGERDQTETEGALRIRVLGRPWQVRGQPHNPFSFRLVPELYSADVVHCHQQHIVSSSFAAFVCRMSKRRVFVTDLGGGGWDVSAYCSTDRWYHGHLHISQYSRQISGHIDNERAHVIYGGVDLKKFRPLGRQREDRCLYVGRVLPHKGIDYLIDALPIGIALDVVGRHYHLPYAEYLRTRATGKQVRFLTECDDTEVVERYNRAMCVVLPSVYKTVYGEESLVPELLGQTLLEGMACETPAICTQVASMPEIVVDGKTGFIVPPNDAPALQDRLLWLRDNPALARKMGQQARERVQEKFYWPKVVEQCLNIYSQQ